MADETGQERERAGEAQVRQDSVGATTATARTTVSGPPVAPRGPTEQVDPRSRLQELAQQLVRVQNRRLLMEYLGLRRQLRA